MTRLTQEKVFGIAETRQSLSRILLVMTLIVAIIMALELILNFNVTSPSLLAAPLLGFVVLYVSYRFRLIGHVLTKIGFLVLLFISLESHFLINLKSFHTLSYWMVLVPLSALILVGSRGSLVLLVIVIGTNIFNAFMGISQYGITYDHNLSYVRNLSGASLLVICAYSFAFIFYFRLQRSYQKMALQKNVITDLNTQLQTFIDNLKMDLEDRYSEVEDFKGRMNQIAFHNSHVVRSPLAKIMVASGLLGGEHDDFLIKTIKESADELDQVIREVASLSKKEEE